VHKEGSQNEYILLNKHPDFLSEGRGTRTREKKKEKKRSKEKEKKNGSCFKGEMLVFY